MRSIQGPVIGFRGKEKMLAQLANVGYQRPRDQHSAEKYRVQTTR